MTKYIKCTLCEEDTPMYKGEWRTISYYRDDNEYFSCDGCTRSLIEQQAENEDFGVDGKKLFFYWRKNEYDNSEFMTEQQLKDYESRDPKTFKRVNTFIEEAELYDEITIETPVYDVTIIRAG